MSDNGSVRRIATYLEESSNGIHENTLESKNLYNGTIYLTGEIDSAAAIDFSQKLLYLEERSDIYTINIVISSPGGAVDAGLAIYDQIQTATKPINIICVTMAASMAAVILAGGQKGRRYILPHSKTMLHEPLIPQTGGSATSIKETADSIIATKKELVNIIAKHTGKSTKAIDKDISYDHYMSAKESVEFGLCDAILEQPLSELLRQD